MLRLGELYIDPVDLAGDAFAGEIELVVFYTEPAATRAVLERVQLLTAGLSARVLLLAVHALPYPLPFVCPTATHAFLVDQLSGLSRNCTLPVASQIVLARSREEGFRHVLKSESTILVGTQCHVWLTAAERLAKMLVADGHKVILLHVD